MGSIVGSWWTWLVDHDLKGYAQIFIGVFLAQVLARWIQRKREDRDGKKRFRDASTPVVSVLRKHALDLVSVKLHLDTPQPTFVELQVWPPEVTYTWSSNLYSHDPVRFERLISAFRSFSRTAEYINSMIDRG